MENCQENLNVSLNVSEDNVIVPVNKPDEPCSITQVSGNSFLDVVVILVNLKYG